MGNTSSIYEDRSSVAPAEKKPDTNVIPWDRNVYRLYELVDMHGTGRMITAMRRAYSTGDHTEIDNMVQYEMFDFLFNEGKGKMFPNSELVIMRNKERNAKLGVFSKKKGKGKSGPNVLDGLDQGDNAGDLKKALKLLDGGGKGGKGESKYRELVWKFEERGSMGNTLLGVCLLHGGAIHNLLALKLIEFFPKLVNDICISEEYYGLSPLHQAIINQNPEMVRKLLKYGADVNQRCYGSFFCAEDQKASRADSLEHEYVELTPRTNYTGTMYYGEYPLSFAVCMDQPDMFRLLVAHKANLNAQDTNGNTVLHLCVIHDKMDMMQLALQAGAKLRLSNKQNLTPLTLAAKLAKKKIFNHILALECETVWAYGESSCTAYPLMKIDSIKQDTGEMNEDSALSLVVYGETSAHLELLDGLLENILEEKWNGYCKNLWLQSLFGFLFYFLFFTAAFMTRPISATTEEITNGMVDAWGEIRNNSLNTTYFITDHEKYDPSESQCHLLHYEKWPWYHGYLRLFCEAVVIACVLFQIFSDIKVLRTIGRKKWWSIMYAFPAKLIYKSSFLLVLLIIPVRFGCSLHPDMLMIDNVLSALAVIMTDVHFLYYCRAVPFVGPFVLMVYTIIATDITRFIAIYFIFLFGFSQSFYVVFGSCERAASHNAESQFQNVMQSIPSALIRTFIMTMNEYTVLYGEMASCDSPLMNLIGKLLFIIYETFVSILQVNLLIAMMTRTYETILLAKKEWKRQWAQVILMLELSLGQKKRLLQVQKYSRPDGTDKSKRTYVVIKKGMGDRSPAEEAEERERRAEKVKEEKRALMRKRLRELELKEEALKAMGRSLHTSARRVMLRQSTLPASVPS